MAYRTLRFGKIENIKFTHILEKLQSYQGQRKKTKRYGILKIEQIGDEFIWGLYGVEKRVKNKRFDESGKNLIDQTIVDAKSIEFLIQKHNNGVLIAVHSINYFTPEEFILQIKEMAGDDDTKDAQAYIVTHFSKEMMRGIYREASFVNRLVLREVGEHVPNPWGTTDPETVKLVKTAKGIRRMEIEAERRENILEKEIVNNVLAPYSRLMTIAGKDKDGNKIFINDTGRVVYSEPKNPAKQKKKTHEMVTMVFGKFISGTSSTLKKLVASDVKKERDDE